MALPHKRKANPAVLKSVADDPNARERAAYALKPVQTPAQQRNSRVRARAPTAIYKQRSLSSSARYGKRPLSLIQEATIAQLLQQRHRLGRRLRNGLGGQHLGEW